MSLSKNRQVKIHYDRIFFHPVGQNNSQKKETAVFFLLLLLFISVSFHFLNECSEWWISISKVYTKMTGFMRGWRDECSIWVYVEWKHMLK